MLLLCVQGRDGHAITVADGPKPRLTRGQLILLEDTTGKGHITHVVGATDHVAVAMEPPAGWPGS